MKALTLYRSGHCGIGNHGRCTGAYAGAACSCDCHTAQPERCQNGIHRTRTCPTCGEAL